MSSELLDCAICEKKFAELALPEHIADHMGYKPHGCAECPLVKSYHSGIASVLAHCAEKKHTYKQEISPHMDNAVQNIYNGCVEKKGLKENTPARDTTMKREEEVHIQQRQIEEEPPKKTSEPRLPELELLIESQKKESQLALEETHHASRPRISLPSPSRHSPRRQHPLIPAVSSSIVTTVGERKKPRRDEIANPPNSPLPLESQNSTTLVKAELDRTRQELHESLVRGSCAKRSTTPSAMPSPLRRRDASKESYHLLSELHGPREAKAIKVNFLSGEEGSKRIPTRSHFRESSYTYQKRPRNRIPSHVSPIRRGPSRNNSNTSLEGGGYDRTLVRGKSVENKRRRDAFFHEQGDKDSREINPGKGP